MVDLMNETPDVSTPRLEMKDIYREVTTARQALRDSYQNLQNVADYCEKNYMEAPDKRKALESTMSLVTQTLASVACQVGVAARHMSDMLEVQSLILQKEEAKVRYVSQLLDIHMEKVERQKIGKLTTAKKYPHSQKIQNLQNNRRLGSYTRMPINFTSLDNTGHGITDSDSQLSRTGTMSRKSVKNMGQAHNSMGRSSRVREPVIPPIIPAQMVPCPTSPDTTSPSFPCPTRMNGDFSLPPPERPASWTQQSLETDVQFPDLPPPPESAENGSLWLPMPTIEDVPMSNCKSLESIDECFPPPPAVDNEEHSLWPTGNGFPPPACTEQSADDLPPPPAPEYEMIHTFWPGENADTMDGSTSLDDLPPPPPPSDF
ncbi:ABI gene family member 3 isoform X1 [Eleutherodactylus coqui]|uniref:ABI gene family member 3 isoform X1 n=1 Tax=Eleutherodactylus coqui TaxID=57060 RepID=UPI003461D4CD